MEYVDAVLNVLQRIRPKYREMGPALDAVHHSHRDHPQDCDGDAYMKDGVEYRMASLGGKDAAVEEQCSKLDAP